MYKKLIRINKDNFKLLIEVEFSDTLAELPDIEKIAQSILDAVENPKTEESDNKKRKGRA